MIYLWIILFIVILIVFWLTNLFGMPGNWFMIGAAAIWTWLLGDSLAAIGWKPILLVIALAGFGELLEFGASVLGTKKMGGGRRAATLSVIGSVIGAIAGAFIALPIPIPVISWVVSSVLFACIGALIGATWGEKWQGSSLNSSLKVGGAAFAGRFVGTLSKIGIGAVILTILVVSLFF